MGERKLPYISKKIKICIICEGEEEYEYFSKLILLNVWHEKYKFVLKNAKSLAKVFAHYQYTYLMDDYSLVLIFCDTDDEELVKTKKHYETLKKKIIDHHNNRNSSKVLIFANPCTMQIILSHFGEIKLKSRKKSINSVLIKKLTNIDNYDGREKQRTKLFDKITKNNYEDMKKRIKKLSNIDTNVPSTNLDEFLENFSCEETKWLDKINKNL
jgi:hypothetical protein